jgi:hypothetical protein
MPQDLADSLYTHLLDRFPADRDYPRGALYVEGMPPLVASLLGRTLDRWLEHELDALESRWFDFNDPGVRAARAELVVALGRTARVPRGAWTETLRYAVGLTVRHLATPARALTDATFEGQPDPLPTDTVRARLHTFEAYPYLPEIADAYLAQKRPETVDPETLHGLLLRIDRRVTADYAIEDWSRLLSPLFKLSRHVPDSRGVPAPLLAGFFASKGIDEVADALRQRGDRAVDEAALREILENHLVNPPASQAHHTEPPAGAVDAALEDEEPHRLAGAPEDEESHRLAEEVDQEEAPLERATARAGDLFDDAPPPDAERERQPGPAAEAPSVPAGAVDDESAEAVEPAPTHEPPAPTVLAAREVELPDSPAIVPPAEAEDEEEPLWKRFASGGGPTVETAVPAGAEAPPRDAGPVAGGEEPAPIWKRFLAGLRGTGEPHETEPLPPAGTETPELDALEQRVLGRAGRRQRGRFVRDLFDGDDGAYATVLQKIDRCDSWSAASQTIARDVFRRYGVDIYSPTAVAFTDAVNGAFDR